MLFRSNGSGRITSNGFTGFDQVFTLGNEHDGRNPLPILAVDLSLNKLSDAIQLDWSLVNQQNVLYYEIYRSDDANQFELLSTIQPGSIDRLMAKDVSPIEGINYYYVKAIYQDGNEVNSSIKSIDWSIVHTVSLFPNPSNNSDLNIKVDDQDVSQVDVKVIAINGKLVYQKTFDLPSENMVVPSNDLQAGSYIVNVSSPSKNYLNHPWILVK